MAKKIKKDKSVSCNDSNEEILKTICASIPGAEILDRHSIAEQGFVTTGIPAIDFICSDKFFDGGIPMGRITEVYGPSSTGKTVIGTHFLRGAQQAGGIGILIDSESAYSEKFSRALGIDTSKLIYMQPDTLEDCFDSIIKVIKLVRSNTTDNRPIAIVYDSIAASPSRAEQAAVEKEEAFKSEMGRRAVACSTYLRNIAKMLSQQNAALIIVNQIRSKIGVLFGSPETTAGGGNSLEYYCSVRLDCRKTKVLFNDKKRAIGIEMKVKNTKNKIATPFKIAHNLELYFNYGISPISGLLKILKEEGRIEQAGAWYTVPETKEKFQSKDFARILRSSPQLIDAPNQEAVDTYLQIHEGLPDLIEEEEEQEEE